MAGPIVFGTDGWRATLDTFTTERVEMVGQAVARYLADHGLTTAPVGIAYDPREGSAGFAQALARVLNDNAIDVRMTDRDRPTPLLAWNVAEQGLAGGLMITASHNPPTYNGVKFITPVGAPALPAVTDALEARIAEPRVVPAAEGSRTEPLDGLDPYLDHLLQLIDRRGVQDLSIAYDAMHGSGRGVTDRVLREAGAAVTTYRCTRDPTFGGDRPEPSAERLGAMRREVAQTDADLGIANDGDADRIAVITADGEYLDPNLYFACVYDYLLEDAAGPVVRTVSTTALLDRIAAAHDQEVIETPVGFKWVAAAMREHDALAGGEESGGFSIRGHVREKDGVMMALLTAAMAAKEPLHDRVDRLLSTYGTIAQDRIGVVCPEERKVSVIEEIGETLPEELAGSPVASVSEVDGYKVTLADGAWMLVRPSGTEPTMRVYAEAESRERVEAILEAGRSLLERAV